MNTNLQSELSQFTGSERWFRHWTRQLVYTEGVEYLAKEAGAYWLIDAIASYQRDKRITGNQNLREMQFWKLTVKDGAGELTCVEDSGKPPAITQKIEFTDFPMESVELWLELGSVDGETPAYVLMLPSER